MICPYENECPKKSAGCKVACGKYIERAKRMKGIERNPFMFYAFNKAQRLRDKAYKNKKYGKK